MKFRKFKISAFIMAAFLMLMPSFAYAQCSVPDSGLLDYWKLDETSTTTANNALGGNNGTMQGGLDAALHSVSGQIGTALDFSGGNYYIEVAPNPDYDLGASDAFAVSVWFQFGGANGFQELFRTDTAGNRFTIQRTNLGYLNFGINSTIITSTTDLNDSNWHHVVATRTSGGDMSLYIDGQLAASGGNDSSAAANTTNYWIGGRQNNSNWFNGLLDDVRLYNRYMSLEEAQSLYAQRSADNAPAGKLVFDAKHARMIYCNGTSWVHAGTGSYNPNAVHFDGSDQLYEGVITEGVLGAADGTKGTASVWFKLNSWAGTKQRILNATAGAFGIQFLASGEIEVHGRSAAGGDILQLRTTSFGADTNDWHHLMASWDLTDTEKRHLFIDGVSDLNAAIYLNSAVRYTANQLAVGATVSNVENFDGFMADLWYDPNTYIDLSIESNREKFRSPRGLPMYLGPDGSLVNGVSPELFLSGDTINWSSNKGTGPDLTQTGAITYASTQPGDQILVDTGYFVLIGNQPTNAESNEYDGNLGGLSGANTECLNFLSTYDWLGKDHIELSSSNVYAWLCDETTCQHMLPDTQYAFATAQVGKETAGGATFVTDGSGKYPASDATPWDGSTHFDRTTYFWTGRNTTQDVNSGDNCLDWGSNSNANTGWKGRSDTTNDRRWNDTANDCDTTDQYICFVNPGLGCSGSTSGRMRYDADHHVLTYCNGGEWVPMGPVGGRNVTTGLIGHWQLNETSGGTLTDSAGSNDGTWDDGGNDDVFEEARPGGVLGGALEFSPDCTGACSGFDEINAGSAAVLDNLGPLSVCAWVKPRPGGQWNFSIIGKIGTSFGDDGWQLYYNNPAGNYFGFRSTLEDNVGAETKMVNDVWQHVCGTWDGNDGIAGINVYQNGVNAGVGNSGTSGGSDAGEPGYDLIIGGNPGASTFFEGVMDDVRLYNVELTAQDIEDIYYYGLSGGILETVGTCSNPAGEPGMLVYNADHSVMQYCNGQNWIGIGQ